MSALDLARLQFAFTVSFHIIFPVFSIGLASYLAVFNGTHLITGRSVYLDLFNYWKKIFAIAFGMGVVSGIVMSYQFGTNWSVYSDKVGPVLGPLMGYEVLSASFSRRASWASCCLARERVGPALHAVATLMVALGTFMSAFWILSVNSWMQTPQGYSMNARASHCDELARGHFQSVLPLPARAHGARRVPHDRVRRRRRRRAASHPRPCEPGARG